MNWTKLLFDAVKKNDIKLVEEALQNGASVKYIDDYDILTVAISYHGAAAFLIVKKLLDAGADPNFCDKEDGKTPLYWAAIDIDLVDLLISEGASVDAEAPEDGYTSLHSAVEEENFNVLKALVKTGCEKAISTFDYIERTPLIIAAIKGNIDIASVLIKCGVNINAKSTISGKTALGEAIHEGDLDMIEFLLKNGADSSLSGWMGYDNELQAKCSDQKENVKKIIDLLRTRKKIEGVTH